MNGTAPQPSQTPLLDRLARRGFSSLADAYSAEIDSAVERLIAAHSVSVVAAKVAA